MTALGEQRTRPADLVINIEVPHTAYNAVNELHALDPSGGGFLEEPKHRGSPFAPNANLTQGEVRIGIRMKSTALSTEGLRKESQELTAFLLPIFVRCSSVNFTQKFLQHTTIVP